MIDILLSIAPWLAGLIGIVAGLFMHQQAKATKAQAAQEVAETKQEVDDRNTAAAQKAAQATGERGNVENEIAAMPAADREQRLRDDWTRE
ncbi:hypothetical protein [Herbaspirillum rubrisubalbicans]|uniref:Uncharacterized protein n=1 Tax=Herbaspirillum rubrisubalbicans TaxID=80842 RepID=A0AAD0U4U5_9BURK|nr:hypothetical protein [Herbaspirillum rubrisubalbicans]AYR23040.1 hypothetical protein RC54_04040 [Herbaspirillum rubrisubalbicans]